MNKLYSKPPSQLIIGGRKYKINTDYRVWIKFETMLIKDDKISLNDIIKLIFKNEIPPAERLEETTEQILWFYRCGQVPASGGSDGGDQVFDYDYDAGYIFAAFLQQYKIDISDINLHWWKFRGLFLSLSDDTVFVKIMGYRSIKITSKMTSEQKTFYTKMKKLYAIPLPKKLRDKYDAIEDALLQGKPIDNLL